MEIVELFKGFSKLKLTQRFQRLMSMGALSSKDVSYLKSGGIQNINLADNFIENSIGYFQLPMGVVTNMNIDGRDYVIPMAVEETSIIAAASKTARWIRERGEITTEVVGENIIGQVQVARVKNYELFKSTIELNKEKWIKELNQNPAAGMYARGGGVTDMQVRQIARPDGESMAVLHIHLNPCDAMGANVMNQVCEYITQPLTEATGETITMRILSNLVDTKLTRAQVTMRGLDAERGEAIQEASIFAETDPYRAATNNKGVLNGIDPILIATGNDWRAVESGIHAYCCRDGQYRSVTKWRYTDSVLTGIFEAPLICGTVGGVTNLHPTAKMSMKMMEIESANHLSRICAAVGLVQNLGALRALTSVGIIEGHMKLHITNLAIGAGAQEHEQAPLQILLEQLLKVQKRITQSDAVQALTKLRHSMKEKNSEPAASTPTN